MLLTQEHFNQLIFIPLLVTFGPLVTALIWINWRAAWFRSLSATRQLLTVLGLTAWLFGIGVPFLNYRHWLDVAEVWIVRDSPLGIVKEDWMLIGSAALGLRHGQTVTLRADANHYRWLINDSTHPLRRTSVFYGACPPQSPYTAIARLQALGIPLDIPPGDVLDNPWSGEFGNGPAPQETTLVLPKRFADDWLERCERLYWYAPVK